MRWDTGTCGYQPRPTQTEPTRLVAACPPSWRQLGQRAHLPDGLVNHGNVGRTLTKESHHFVSGPDHGVQFGIRPGDISAEVDQIFRLAVKRESLANFPRIDRKST